MTFEGLDQAGRIRTAGSLNRFKNLSHGCIAQIAAGCRRMVVLVDHPLNETLGTFRIDLGIPNEPPNARIVGVPERATDLLTTDQASNADFFLGELKLCVALKSIDEKLPLHVQSEWCR